MLILILLIYNNSKHQYLNVVRRTTAELHIASRKRLNVGALLAQRLYSDHIN